MDKTEKYTGEAKIKAQHSEVDVKEWQQIQSALVNLTTEQLDSITDITDKPFKELTSAEKEKIISLASGNQQDLMDVPLKAILRPQATLTGTLTVRKAKKPKKESVDIEKRLYMTLFNDKFMHKLRQHIGKGNNGFNADYDEIEFKKNDGNITLKVIDENHSEALEKLTLQQSGGVLEVMEKLQNKLEHLDRAAVDVYIAMTHHWIENKIEEGKNKGEAYITFEKIHFDYRGLTGKNKRSTLTDQQREKYESILKTLDSIVISIDITNEKGKFYEQIRKSKATHINSRIFRYEFATEGENGEEVGFYYDFGKLSDTFNELLENMINRKYPATNLKLDSRYYSAAQNVVDHIAYHHRINWHGGDKKKQRKKYEIALPELLEIANYEIPKGRAKLYLTNFVERQLNEAVRVLKEDYNFISKIDIPTDINGRNYKSKTIAFHWNMNSFDNYKD